MRFTHQYLIVYIVNIICIASSSFRKKTIVFCIGFSLYDRLVLVVYMLIVSLYIYCIYIVYVFYLYVCALVCIYYWYLDYRKRPMLRIIFVKVYIKQYICVSWCLYFCVAIIDYWSICKQIVYVHTAEDFALQV